MLSLYGYTTLRFGGTLLQYIIDFMGLTVQRWKLNL